MMARPVEFEVWDGFRNFKEHFHPDHIMSIGPWRGDRFSPMVEGECSVKVGMTEVRVKESVATAVHKWQDALKGSGISL
jgi:hypothetical protein